jgi:hypothetical protein
VYRYIGFLGNLIHDNARPIVNMFEMHRFYTMSMTGASDKEMEEFCRRHPMGRKVWAAIERTRERGHHSLWASVSTESSGFARPVIPNLGVGSQHILVNIANEEAGFGERAITVNEADGLVDLLRACVDDYDDIYKSWWLDNPFRLPAGMSALESMSQWTGCCHAKRKLLELPQLCKFLDN